MDVRRYTPKDFPELSAWAQGWGTHYSEDMFPKTGFIVPGIAAYFLYRTDSSVCYLENLVSNPKCSSKDRDQALGLLTRMILSEAKEQGCRVAYACTDIGKVVERAISMGARFKPKHVLLIKTLS